jgi:DNA polymerase III epsilon subunit-like protein
LGPSTGVVPNGGLACGEPCTSDAKRRKLDEVLCFHRFSGKGRTLSFRVNPRDSAVFHPLASQVHRITRCMLQNEHRFPEAFERIKDFVREDPMYCHGSCGSPSAPA